MFFALVTFVAGVAIRQYAVTISKRSSIRRASYLGDRVDKDEWLQD